MALKSHHSRFFVKGEEEEMDDHPAGLAVALLVVASAMILRKSIVAFVRDTRVLWTCMGAITLCLACLWAAWHWVVVPGWSWAREVATTTYIGSWNLSQYGWAVGALAGGTYAFWAIVRVARRPRRTKLEVRTGYNPRTKIFPGNGIYK